MKYLFAIFSFMFVIVYGSCSHSHFLTPPGHPSGGLLSPFSSFSPFYLSTQVPKLLSAQTCRRKEGGEKIFSFFSFRETLPSYPLPTNGNKKSFPLSYVIGWRGDVCEMKFEASFSSYDFPQVKRNCLKDFFPRPPGK